MLLQAIPESGEPKLIVLLFRPLHHTTGFNGNFDFCTRLWVYLSPDLIIGIKGFV